MKVRSTLDQTPPQVLSLDEEDEPFEQPKTCNSERHRGLSTFVWGTSKSSFHSCKYCRNAFISHICEKMYQCGRPAYHRINGEMDRQFKCGLPSVMFDLKVMLVVVEPLEEPLELLQYNVDMIHNVEYESNDSSDVSLVDEIENEENMVLDSADFCDLDGYDMDLQLSSDE
ncbi:hypothetical protein ACOSQ2_003481 [Xanthoceras sorbifolium]